MSRLPWGNFPKITRDTSLLIGGLLGTAHETLVSKVDRPSLLALFAGMMGLPLFLRKDEKEREDEDEAEAKRLGPAPEGEG
jgi:hypothetical protein